ncbi:unnamed protein product [Paramecium octaurelia]|uniref:Uncharacterized protein n=1 Tax=Paramecium octaurelia TaxID=43137 RepID=A0A8S1VIL3_PAROT|nr:unnamed protein product [Paramecium octaurelia]
MSLIKSQEAYSSISIDEPFRNFDRILSSAKIHSEKTLNFISYAISARKFYTLLIEVIVESQMQLDIVKRQVY